MIDIISFYCSDNARYTSLGDIHVDYSTLLAFQTVCIQLKSRTHIIATSDTSALFVINVCKLDSFIAFG